MKMPALFLALLVAVLLAVPARAQDKETSPAPDQNEPSAKKIQQLQQQRLGVLKEMSDQIRTLHSKGLASIDEVYEARLAVLQAEIDATTDDSKRVTFSKDMLGVLTEWEQSADALHRSARTEGTNYLRIKARRLQAEIVWEQAKAKGTQTKY
jgi:hypothetical protein